MASLMAREKRGLWSRLLGNDFLDKFIFLILLKFYSMPILKFKISKQKPEYFITRFALLRLLGFVYFFAFLSLATQVIPLIGENGLLPAKNFLETFRFDSKLDAFFNLPTIFWFGISDNMLLVLSWIGVILSFIVVIGFANIPIMLVLWFLYMSFVHIGQLFYGYGWEIQLLETGFLAVFLCPLWDFRPFPRTAPPKLVIWLFRWLAFRIYLGAGLIKIRGDSCWRDLTCLYYHYETQPIPNPLSPYFHFMPKWFHMLGVLWNHFVELIVPFFAFYPQIARHIAGILMISFQFILMLSGNLSFLNWVTIIPVIACFDDSFLRKIMPKWVTSRAEYGLMHKRTYKPQKIIAWILVIAIAWLSIPVVQNLLSSGQYMNTSFNQWGLVNTYGAFGSVGKIRPELVIEGTDETAITSQTKWKAYEFKAKPTDIYRKLPIIAPYQPRIDWQIWFAAMQRPEHNPWLIHMIWKLLDNDKDTLSLLADNPFPKNPPKYIRVGYYKYSFVPLNDKSGAVWNREYIGQWLPPLSRTNPELQQYIKAYGWKN